MLIGADTNPPSAGVPAYTTFSGVWNQISREIKGAFASFTAQDRSRIRGVFIHSGKNTADATLDTLLQTTPLP